MEFPPEDWPCFAAEEFELAVPRDPGELGMEVMAQARPAGRILDHLRTALGGSSPLTVTFNTRDVFLAPAIPSLDLQLELWPRDILIRRNMSTSEWMDVRTMLSSNEIFVIPPEEAAGSSTPASNEELLAYLDEARDQKGHVASIRWAVGSGADELMELVLQGFPSSAANLSGKPAFRG